MSRTFSTNSGSAESLKVSARCGFSPKACQTRWTVAGDRPHAAAIERVLQWVASAGMVSSVRTSSSAPRSSGDRARGAAARPVAQPLEPVPREALAPLADGVGADAGLAGHGLVRRAFGAAQHDPGPDCQVLRGLAPADQPL